MNYHQRLYRTRALMDEVMTAINNLAGTDSRDPSDKDVRTIVQRRGEFQNRLRECFYNIIDIWPDIQSNEARRYEMSTFLSRYRSFRLAVQTAADSPGSPAQLNEALRKLVKYLNELDTDMAFVLAAFSGSLPRLEKTGLSGISQSLCHFVKDVDDEFYERLIIYHQSPARPLRWHGSKVAAALFARHFGLTDSVMNRTFIFPSHAKVYTGLKISSNIATKGDDRYGITAILNNYPYPG